MGEAGTEHLLCWCPAVEGAWQTLAGAGTVWEALGRRSEEDVLLAKLMHQVSYLFHTMEGRAVLGVQRAVNMLVSQ
eukprot:2511960-Lingulodinium_polyedra.AAC.1